MMHTKRCLKIGRLWAVFQKKWKIAFHLTGSKKCWTLLTSKTKGLRNSWEKKKSEEPEGRGTLLFFFKRLERERRVPRPSGSSLFFLFLLRKIKRQEPSRHASSPLYFRSFSPSQTIGEKFAQFPKTTTFSMDLPEHNTINWNAIFQFFVKN